MQIDVITIFPELFTSFLSTSLVGRAVEKGLLRAMIHDLRDDTEDRHRTVDDEPYGGGGGMVMTAPPWIRAVRRVSGSCRPWRILLSPQGACLNDQKVRELAVRSHLLLLCGRYEGVDERVRLRVVDEEISIGSYVLSGGELAAMVLIEALSRQIPGVVGRRDSVERDSFRAGLLDHPHYTRPAVVEGLGVPAVLRSGNQAAIDRWRAREALRSTLKKRPDLLPNAGLSQDQIMELKELAEEEGIASPAIAALERLVSNSDNNGLPTAGAGRGRVENR